MLLLLLIAASLTAATKQQEPQCHVLGECMGLYNGLTVEESYNDCLATCKDKSATCNFFTYVEGTQYCLEYSDCPSLDTTCTDCFSGEQQCQPVEALCGVQGFCDGHVVDVNSTATVEECLELCQAYEDCQWYSYFQESKACILTSDCTYLDESCTDCLAGERECYNEASPTGELLLVVGGLGANYEVELVDLSGANRTCPSMSNYPGAQYGSVGTFISGQALVCGGYTYTNQCYTYNNNTLQWIPTVTMSTVTRVYSAGVLMSGTEWWVTGGGHNLDEITATTELYSSTTESFNSYVNLPEEKTLHNLVRVNSTHYMLLGHWDVGSNKVWMFDRTLRSWRALPNLSVARGETHAGLVSFPDGRRAVVVAGGYQSSKGVVTAAAVGDDKAAVADGQNAAAMMEVNDDNARYSKSCEMFDLAEESWSSCPDLPVSSLGLYGGASVPFGDSFIIVGGYGDSYQDTIIHFDPIKEDWVILPQRLKSGRLLFAALLVPNDFANCT